MPKGWAWLGQICIEKFTYVKNIFKQIKKKIIKKKWEYSIILNSHSRNLVFTD